MSLEDLEKIYLRIGTWHRLRQNEGGATELGDKGIGRLSVMRLGDQLSVETTRSGEGRWNVLEVDWGSFPTLKICSSKISTWRPGLASGRMARKKAVQIIRINSLNGDWTRPRFEEMLDGKIARFIDPFEAGLANKLLIAVHNGRWTMIPSVPKEFMRHAHVICRAAFHFEKGEPVIEGKVDCREKQRATPIEARGSEVMTISRTICKRRAKRGHAAFAEASGSE